MSINLTFRVETITHTTAGYQVEFAQVAWFKSNPEFDAAIKALPLDTDWDAVVSDLPESFLDAEPNEEGAFEVVGNGSLDIHLDDIRDLEPGAYVNLFITDSSTQFVALV